MLSFELFPFKFEREKVHFIGNFTYEEAYGTYFGLKHSEPVRKEMLKDTILASSLLLFFICLC